MDQRTWRVKVDQARDRLYYAWLGALLAGAISIVLLLWVAIDTGEWSLAAPFLGMAALTIGLGYGTLRGSQLAAGAQLVNFVAGMILRWLETGRPGPLLIIGILAYVYVQGFRGAMDLAELRQNEPPPESPASVATDLPSSRPAV